MSTKNQFFFVNKNNFNDVILKVIENLFYCYYSFSIYYYLLRFFL